MNRAPALRARGLDLIAPLIPDVKQASPLTDATGMSDAYKGQERRDGSTPQRKASVERRSGMDRRRGPGRRRGEVRKAAEEGEISGELLEFIMAIDEYKRINERPFPSWSEVFEIMQYLGYRKVAPVAGHINTASNSDVLVSPEDKARDDAESRASTAARHAAAT